MKINVRGDKVKVTASIKAHIEEKISKLDRYFENSGEITATIIIKIRNKDQIVEVTIPTKRYTLRAEESHSDLYAAVDLVMDKLERQIRKNKTRLKERYQNVSVPDFNLEIVEEDKSEGGKIVKRKVVEDKPMNEDEAILQMQLLNHDFFLFKNTDEKCYSVIYLRKDGDYGIINSK